MFAELRKKPKVKPAAKLKNRDHELTRSLMREALVKHPKCIESLRRSLSINHTNLEQFVKYIKEPPSKINHQLNKQIEEQISDIISVDQEKEEKLFAKKQIYLRRGTLKGVSSLKKQLKIQRSNLKLDPAVIDSRTKIQINNNRQINSSNITNKSRGRMITQHTCNFEGNIAKRRINKMQTDLRKTFTVGLLESYEPNQSCSTTQRFWRKNGKSYDSTQNRWKTEGDQKNGQRTLGQLTKYNQTINRRQLKILVMQFQLNVDHYKRLQKPVHFLNNL